MLLKSMKFIWLEFFVLEICRTEAWTVLTTVVFPYLKLAHWARLQMADAKLGIAPKKTLVAYLLLSRNSSSLYTFVWASSTANFIKIGWKVQKIGKNFIYIFTYSMFFFVPLLTTHKCWTSLCRDIRYRIWCKSDKQYRLYM